MNLTVRLYTVHCNVTEDDTGADEVYLLVGAARDLDNPSPNEKISLVRIPELVPIPDPGGAGIAGYKAPYHELNDGDTWQINSVVLSTPVGPGDLEVGVWLFDQDAAAEIEEDQIKNLEAAMNAGGTALAPVTGGKSFIAAGIAGFLLNLIAGIAAMDEDDLLGFDRYTTHILAPGQPNLPPGFPGLPPMKVSRMFKADYDGADYDVYYEIAVTP